MVIGFVAVYVVWVGFIFFKIKKDPNYFGTLTRSVSRY